uniref:Uncharacterized protein n=1 Tax=Aegilops tauschii subsp. strangulata TaxID=200361 RepID=A0A453KSU4_AEGTS
MSGSSVVWPHTRAALLHRPADKAHRDGQPRLLPAAAWRWRCMRWCCGADGDGGGGVRGGAAAGHLGFAPPPSAPITQAASRRTTPTSDRRKHHGEVREAGEGRGGHLRQGVQGAGQGDGPGGGAQEDPPGDGRDDEGIPTTALREISLLRLLSSSLYIVRLLAVEQATKGGGAGGGGKPVLYLVFEFLDTDLKKFVDAYCRGPAPKPLPTQVVKALELFTEEGTRPSSCLVVVSSFDSFVQQRGDLAFFTSRAKSKDY